MAEKISEGEWLRKIEIDIQECMGKSRLSFAIPMPPSKNNGKRIVHASGRPFIIPGKAYMQWADKAGRSLKKFLDGCSDDFKWLLPIKAYTIFEYIIFVSRKNHLDTDNMFKGLHDIFQEVGLVYDDRYIMPRVKGIYKTRGRENAMVLVFIQDILRAHIDERKTHTFSKKVHQCISKYMEILSL
ncbi:MAG: hypothetical protein D6752_07070 [Candidatus Nitrosothermus koennekii]|nr:MAG: hypothetical protein D6752_07070 [Candidatus Nitrosothermus koennekii]